MLAAVEVEVVAVAGTPPGADADEEEEGGRMASAGPCGGGRPWDVGASSMAMVVGTGAETEAVASTAVAAGGLYVVVVVVDAGAEAAGAAGAGEEDDAMTAEGGTGLEGVVDMVYMCLFIKFVVVLGWTCWMDQQEQCYYDISISVIHSTHHFRKSLGHMISLLDFLLATAVV